MSKLFTGTISNAKVYDHPLTEREIMLIFAHQDAQRTGHCHWCHMTPIKDKHLITGYTHAKFCELSVMLEGE